MFFDTHAHYDSASFDSDRKEILQIMPTEGVQLILNPGCDGFSSRASLALSDEYEYIYAAVGWHPEEWEKWSDASFEEIESLAEHPKAVAIGEIGLDYYWDKEHKELQKEILHAQLGLAMKKNKPVIIHDRDAHEDCLNAVSCYPGLRGVFHCFSGSVEMARILLKDGWYLGFDGPITYKNNKKAAQIIEETPLERILLETDSPYMTPVPHRGKRNNSTMIPFIADKIAEIKGISCEAVLQAGLENGKKLFGIE